MFFTSLPAFEQKAFSFGNSMKIQTESNELVIKLDYRALLENEELALALTRYHAYESSVLNCLAQIATTGQVEWNGDDMPWRSFWTGPGEPNERLRLLIASIAEPTAQKLIDDLKSERDKQEQNARAMRAKIFDLERKLRSKERELAEN